MLGCISGPNLEILTWICSDLSHGQAQKGVNFYSNLSHGQAQNEVNFYFNLWLGQAQNGVNFDFKLNLTLKVKVTEPQNNSNLNQGVLHLLSKFGGSSLNRWWVIMCTSSWLMEMVACYLNKRSVHFIIMRKQWTVFLYLYKNTVGCYLNARFYFVILRKQSIVITDYKNEVQRQMHHICAFSCVFWNNNNNLPGLEIAMYPTATAHMLLITYF